MRPTKTSPTKHAPRRKSCQALLPDGATPCSATFRGWGRYCTPHLEECARLQGRYKDAVARADRLRRTGELSDRQVRSFGTGPEAGFERAVERVRAYLMALEEEEGEREALVGRFPAERDERLVQRANLVQERKAACVGVMEQLEQQRRERNASRESDPESQPLLGRARTRRVWAPSTVQIALLILALVLTSLLVVMFLTGRVLFVNLPAYH